MQSFVVFSKHPRLHTIADPASVTARWSGQTEPGEMETMEHGFGAWTVRIPMARRLALYWQERLGQGMHLVCSERGTTVYEGRIEDSGALAVDGGLELTMLGYWRAFTDYHESAAWSVSTLNQGWEAINKTSNSARDPEAYVWSVTDQIMRFGFNQDEGYRNTKVLSVERAVPANSVRSWVTLEITLKDLNLRESQRFSIDIWNDGIASPVTLQAFNGPLVDAGPTTYSYSFLATPRTRIGLQLFDTRTGKTFSLAVTAGAGKTITVGSTTGLYRGQRLLFTNSATPQESEPVFVRTIPTGTTFTVREIENDYAIGDTIDYVYTGETNAHGVSVSAVRIKSTTASTVPPDTVARAVLANVAAFNPTQINPATSLINPSGYTMADMRIYEPIDQYADEMLDFIRDVGERDGWLWAAQVWEHQRLTFDRRYDLGLAMVFQIRETPEIRKTLDAVRTRLVPLSENADGTPNYGAAVINVAAEQRLGFKRSAIYTVPTVTGTDATTLATSALADQAPGNVRGDIVVKAVYRGNTPWPLWMVRAGYVIECVGFPTAIGTSPTKVKRFRAGATRYNPITQELTISPELRLPRIDLDTKRRGVQGLDRG